MSLPIRKPIAVEVEEGDHIDLSVSLWDPREDFDQKLVEDYIMDVITPMSDFDPANMLNVASKEEEPDWEWLRECFFRKRMKVVKAT